MNFKTVIGSLVGVAAVSATVRYSELNSEEVQQLFSDFKTKYKHIDSYRNTEHETSRFAIFKTHLNLIDERNMIEEATGGSAVHGITQFADITQEEFVSTYLDTSVKHRMNVRGSNATIATHAPYTGSADAIDYTGKQTTAIKDQGNCGSCWAHAAAEQLESDGMRLLGNPSSLTLSVQQFVSCDHGPEQLGCGGGLQETGYDYAKEAGGIVSEEDYPYVSGTSGESGTCDTSKTNYLVGVNSFDMILETDPADTESGYTSYMFSKSGGTISIGVDASMWSTYKGGVMTRCGAGKVINHSVQLVGVDTDSKDGYWKIRNSWSSDWGEDGAIRIAYGSNTCGLATEGGSYVSVFNV